MKARSRFVCWLQRPLVTLALFLLIAGDVVFVFRAYTWSGAKNHVTTTAIPWYVSRHLLRVDVPDVEFAYPWSSFFVREGGAYRDLDAMRTSADELTKLLASRPEDVIEIRRTRFVGQRGWWVPTREVSEHRLRITRMSDGAALDQDAAAREAYRGTMFGKRDPELERLLKSDVLDVRTMWFGYAHNAAMLLAMVLFAISLGWVPRLWGAQRRRRLLAKNVCPKCGYDLSGTTMVAGARTCPECGRAWVVESKGEAAPLATTSG